MLKIIATTIACAIILPASSQSNSHPPKPAKPAAPPVEEVIGLPAPPVVLSTPATPPTPGQPATPPTPGTPPIPEIVGDMPDDYKLFLKKNRAVRSVSWNHEFVIIRMKTGKEERYRLDDEQSIQDAEEKYGKLPIAPPPPPLPTPPLPPSEKRKERS